MSKSILYITQYFPPEVGAGAVRADSIVKKLGEKGWDVDVVSEIPNYPTGIRYPGFEKGSYFKEKLTQNITLHRIWVHINRRKKLGEKLLIFFSFMISSYFYVLGLGKRFDVVYCSSPPLFAGLSAMILSKIMGSKFIFEVRDLWPDSAKDSFRSTNSPAFRFGLWLEKLLYDNADLVISVTDYLDEAIKEKSPDSHVKLVYNGVDTDMFYPMDKEEITLDEDVNTSKFIVGYVGSLGVIQDLETVIRAAKLCEQDPDIHFVIVGGGENQHLEKVLDEVQPKNMSWVGLKSYDKIPHYINAFDIAVNPIKNKPIFHSVMSVKLYEYMACGVPVLTSDMDSVAKIAEESDGAITFGASDYQDLSQVILSYKDKSKELKQIGMNGRKYILERFNRNVLAEELANNLNVYSKRN